MSRDIDDYTIMRVLQVMLSSKAREDSFKEQLKNEVIEELMRKVREIR